MGNGGIFRFGEFAAAGSTQSSVVSVLRAQCGDGFQFTWIHPPSTRVSLEAWWLSREGESRAFISAPLVLLVGDVMWCSAKVDLQKRAGQGSRRMKGQQEVFPGVVKASQGHSVNPGSVGEQDESSWEQLGGRCGGKERLGRIQS